MSKEKEEKTICCDSFLDIAPFFGWFKLDHLEEIKYLMPHIKETNIRINYCPSCGKEVRNIELDYESIYY